MLTRVGTVQAVDVETGEVVGEEKNAFTLLPPKDGVCPECAVDHAWDQPHNQQSLAYQYYFYGRRGRWPTWSDAMAHCTPEVKAHWRQELVRLMQSHGRPVPSDLLEGVEFTR